ncbi:MAG: hypothetical protein ACTHM1_08190 [Solirubrobacteraceae bacterium]
MPGTEPLLAALDPLALDRAALLGVTDGELLEDLLLPQPAASRANAPSTAIAAALGVFM